MWHDGIILKLERNGNPGNLLGFLTDFLRNRKQRVIINVLPQGSTFISNIH